MVLLAVLVAFVDVLVLFLFLLFVCLFCLFLFLLVCCCWVFGFLLLFFFFFFFFGGGEVSVCFVLFCVYSVHIYPRGGLHGLRGFLYVSLSVCLGVCPSLCLFVRALACFFFFFFFFCLADVLIDFLVCY